MMRVRFCGQPPEQPGTDQDQHEERGEPALLAAGALEQPARFLRVGILRFWDQRQQELAEEFHRLSRPHSHSIVAGGFPEMSYTTCEIPFTSFTMRREQMSRKSYGRRAQCAVMKSMVSTARKDTT